MLFWWFCTLVFSVMNMLVNAAMIPYDCWFLQVAKLLNTCSSYWKHNVCYLFVSGLHKSNRLWAHDRYSRSVDFFCKAEWNRILILWNIYYSSESSRVLSFSYGNFKRSTTSKRRNVGQSLMVQKKNQKKKLPKLLGRKELTSLVITFYNQLMKNTLHNLQVLMLAIDMWFHLIMLHEQTTEENVVRVQEKFYSCRMQENETAIAFIMQIVAVQFLFLH